MSTYVGIQYNLWIIVVYVGIVTKKSSHSRNTIGFANFGRKQTFSFSHVKYILKIHFEGVGHLGASNKDSCSNEIW